MVEFTLQQWAIKDLSPHPRNPRQLSKSQYKHLKQSLDKFGLIDKPIVNLDGQIIGGHQRIEVLKGDGVEVLPCWTPDKLMDEREVDELCIRLNVTGSWDDDLLANDWELDDLHDWGVDSLPKVNYDIGKIEVEETIKALKPKKTCPHCGGEIG